ncbi:Inhibitor of growth protein 3 [Halotydeus destructor]|nr:Inhibitor of growth protein 3 [Halotydeus destructor]
MLYLEDYLEIIEHLPQELRDRFTEIREMDLQVHNTMDNLEEDVKQFFLNAKRMKPEQRDAEFQKIKQEYMKTLEDADEKVNLANQIYDLVDRYLRRLDVELHKFKIELEADNAGITEVLERRSLELDNPPPASNHIRERRRYANSSQSSIQAHSHYVRDTGTPNSPFPSNHGSLNARFNSNLYSPSGLLSPSPSVANGNSSLHSTTGLGSHLGGSAPMTPSSTPGSGLPMNFNPLAAAASQAIAATQQMQGRRTASLKASIEAISSPLGTQNILGGDINLGLPGTPGDYMPGAAAPRRRQRLSNAFGDDESSESLQTFNENGHATEWAHGLDPNEPRYCICNQVSYGEMVACDNADCQNEWFHYGCVGLNQAPKGKWYCPNCAPVMAELGPGAPAKKKQKKAPAIAEKA